MVPKSVSGGTYTCKYHEERLADMFLQGHFDQYDIICVQECFGGMPGSLKELFFMYAQKSGFLYITYASSPQFF